MPGGPLSTPAPWGPDLPGPLLPRGAVAQLSALTRPRVPWVLSLLRLPEIP